MPRPRGLLALVALPLLACSLGSPGFDPALWRFVQTVPLRGSKVGGWQEACAYLTFVDDRKLFRTANHWTCGIMVGMPLATTKDGPISPELAARITAAIATEAAGATIHSQPTWLGEDYCILLRTTMRVGFSELRLGATVNQC